MCVFMTHLYVRGVLMFAASFMFAAFCVHGISMLMSAAFMLAALHLGCVVMTPIHLCTVWLHSIQLKFLSCGYVYARYTDE